MKSRNLKLLPLLLIAALSVSLAVQSVHAQQGTLYVLPAHTDTKVVGSTFTVKIQVADIEPFNAWDISVQSDPTVISPQSLTITGNLLAVNFSTTVFELINCINGAGTGCIATDGAGIAHSAVTVFGPPPQTTTGSGLLFTITYKVIGPGFSTIHIFSDVIANGATGAAVPHTTVDGGYGLIVPFDYSLSNSGDITVTQGMSGFNTITATLTGGTPQSVTLSCSSGLPSGASCAFTPSATGSPTFSATLTITTLASTPAGTSTITVTGTPLGATTAPTTFTLTVAPPQVFDYSLSVSPASDSVLAALATTKTTIVTATLTSGTTTSVTLSAKVTGPTRGAGVSVTGFDPTAVTPPAIGATSTMTVSVTADATLGTWTIEITGNPPGASMSTVTYTLTVTTNQPPVASFTVTGNNTATGSTVSFNGGASSDPDGSVVSYAWTFGDGG